MTLALMTISINAACSITESAPANFRLACSRSGAKSTKIMFTFRYKVHKGCAHAQRGTGLSTPLTPSSMLQIESAEDLARYLEHFRADNIVNDAEFIREQMVPDAGKWTVHRQSYGGFCAVTYLSFGPQGLKQVLLTGGIPPIGNGCTADSVYWECIRQIRLPSGGILTPRGLQTIGLSGLGSSTGFERLHYMLEGAWDPVIEPQAQKQLSYYFLSTFERWSDVDTNLLYTLLHESIYCQGASSQWSAHRVRSEHEHIFDAIEAAKEGRPMFFTGEMIFPWMFDEIPALRWFKDAANILAEKEDWPPQYDVPVAGAVYHDDMFVNFKLVQETASQIAEIRLWITNEYMHSGLQDGGSNVFDHLMGMLNGKKPLF
ncbi:Proline iminopeptidase-like protein [Drosera capensis]